MRPLIKDQLSLQVLRKLPIHHRSEMGTYLAICLLGKNLHKIIKDIGPVELSAAYFELLQSKGVTIITKVGTVGKRSDNVEPYRKRGQEIQTRTEQFMRGKGMPDRTTTALGTYFLTNKDHHGHILMIAIDVVQNDDNTLAEEEHVAQLARKHFNLEPINANTRGAGQCGDKSLWSTNDHKFTLDQNIFA
jgi:hypothetical protein